jgi:pyruvate dehydrogenase E2 component (dihydrolipoamide acetyltransferase)
VPVIKDADLLTLEEISILAGELADKAKKGCLKRDEYSGGTFTITNLGMFDIDEFTAVINPPESAILAIGKIDKVPVVEGESIVIKPIVMLSLTYDHRIIDGAPAAQFLQRVKQIMQNPYLLV